MRDPTRTRDGACDEGSWSAGAARGPRGSALASYYLGLLAIIAVASMIGIHSSSPLWEGAVMIVPVGAVASLVFGLIGIHRSAPGTGERRLALLGLAIGMVSLSWFIGWVVVAFRAFDEQIML